MPYRIRFSLYLLDVFPNYPYRIFTNILSKLRGIFRVKIDVDKAFKVPTVCSGTSSFIYLVNSLSALLLYALINKVNQVSETFL